MVKKFKGNIELNSGVILASSNVPSIATLKPVGYKQTHRYKEYGVGCMWNFCVL